MSSRRLISGRNRRPSAAGAAESPAPAPRPHQSVSLPPYQQPSCPLTASAKRSLAMLAQEHDYQKYKKHITIAVSSITNCAAESADRLTDAKEKVKKLAQKREAAEEPSEKTVIEIQSEDRARELEDKVAKLTVEAEKALRQLIDYGDELVQQQEILRGVSEKAAIHPPVVPSGAVRRRRGGDDGEESDDGEEIEVDDSEAHENVLSPLELVQQATEEYRASYTSKTMRARYAENNDYKGFKRVIHDALHPGADAPAVPHASTWFPSDTPAHSTDTPRRRQQATSSGNNNSESDDEIVFAGAVSSLRCPLTLQTFVHPYSNHVCKHTFEKTAILEMHERSAVAFADANQGGRRARGQPTGPRRLPCPEQGCDAMLELKDFFDDQMIVRQVRRAAAAAAAELEEDQLEEAEHMDESSIHMSGTAQQVQSARKVDLLRVKRERVSMARVMDSQPPADEDEEEEDDDDIENIEDEDEIEDV